MNRVFFLLNTLDEFDFQPFATKYLSDSDIDVGVNMPANPADYRLIVLWNIRRIIKSLPSPNNVILFHASDLPEGKGWAPIYYTLAEGRSHFVLSGIFAAPQVDTGDVIVKARFKIPPNAMASDLRRFDSELSILLVAKILERFSGRQITGKAQRGLSTSRPRRTEDDSRINLDQSFRSLIPHLRSCEPGWPAFFEHEGQRYSVEVTPVNRPELPVDIEFTFGEDVPESAQS